MPSAYETMVEQLVALGVPREKAEARARAEHGLPAAGIETPSEAKMREQLERRHTEEGDRLMRALGFEVVRLEQLRASKIHPGLPDRRYYSRARRLAFWWESKAEWGQQRPDQRAFQEMCDACGDPYVLGKLEALKEWLVGHGVATREGELLVPARPEAA